MEVHVSPDGSATLTSKERRFNKRKAKFSKKVLCYNSEHDIKYRGPLGVNGMKILAWVLIYLGFLATLGGIGEKFDAFYKNLEIMNTVFSIVASLSTLCFLLAKFGLIFQGFMSYKRMVLQYGGIMLAIAGAFYLVYLQYIIPAFSTISGVGYFQTMGNLHHSFSALFDSKLSFNVFTDLFIYAVYIATQLYSNPNWSKKKTFAFRMISLLPVLYSFGTYALRLYHVFGLYEIPVFLLPLMPNNTPLIFIAFMIIVAFIKHRKKIYMKYGGTEEQYKEYQQTKANSLYFSKIASLAFVLAAILEIIFVVFILLLSFGSVDTTTVAEDQIAAVALESFTTKADHMNLGTAISSLFFIPVFFMYSYNRKHVKSKLDLFIPVGAIAVIAVTVINFAYYSIMGNLQKILESLKENTECIKNNIGNPLE